MTCIHADDVGFEMTMCNVTGRQCNEHVKPCKYKEERDTLDEIVDVLDCKPLDFE